MLSPEYTKSHHIKLPACDSIKPQFVVPDFRRNQMNLHQPQRSPLYTHARVKRQFQHTPAYPTKPLRYHHPAPVQIQVKTCAESPPVLLPRRVLDSEPKTYRPKLTLPPIRAPSFKRKHVNTVKKERHRIIEKNRRNDINKLIEQLRDAIAMRGPGRVTKVEVLQKAVEYVENINSFARLVQTKYTKPQTLSIAETSLTKRIYRAIETEED